MTLPPEVQAEVLIGDDAEKFFESELGRTILGMAEQDAKAAMIAFDAVDVTDQSKVLEIKVELRSARRFENYLRELITRGREALEAHRHES